LHVLVSSITSLERVLWVDVILQFSHVPGLRSFIVKTTVSGLSSRMPIMTSRIIITVLILTKVIVWGEEPCSPWIWNIETEKCYVKFCDLLKPDEAEKICKKYNGQLLTICSEEENKFVADLARNHPREDGKLHGTWIGLRRDSTRRKWIWRSGSTCEYRKWAFAEPNDVTFDEDYGHLWVYKPNEYRHWNDYRNERSRDFMCEAPYCPLDN
uniref:C-type lectin domain-containing protein n=1 Tax=Haemonchus placei TaxID=6290 RepID=A0A0N4WER9_HAEPC